MHTVCVCEFEFKGGMCLFHNTDGDRACYFICFVFVITAGVLPVLVMRCYYSFVFVHLLIRGGVTPVGARTPWSVS